MWPSALFLLPLHRLGMKLFHYGNNVPELSPIPGWLMSFFSSFINVIMLTGIFFETEMLKVSIIISNYSPTSSTVSYSSLAAAPDNFSMSFNNCSAIDIFTFKSVSSCNISTAINTLSTVKANGVDNVPVTMLKKSSAIVVPILASLFNLSIATGTFLDCLKQALVIPVHKKGDTCKISNYRPITLLSTVNKLFEKLIHSQLSMFLVDHMILSDKQHGFRSGFLYEMALCRLSSLLSEAKRMKKDSVLVTLDFSRAFDT